MPNLDDKRRVKATATPNQIKANVAIILRGVGLVSTVDVVSNFTVPIANGQVLFRTFYISEGELTRTADPAARSRSTFD
jgi:hypothetical protein